MVARQRWALGGSLLIHAALVLLLGASLMTPKRDFNRVEIDLEGMATPNRTLGVRTPNPSPVPNQPTTVAVPVETTVPMQLRMPQVAPPRPATSFDADASLAAPATPALPGQPAVALQRPVGGTPGGGSGKRGTGRGSVLDGYRNSVRMHIDRAKRYPNIAQQRRLEGVAVVSFRLSSDGKVIDGPDLVKGSGYNLIDKAALRAVTRGAPYPKYPGPSDPDGHAFEVPVSFHLR
jgi:protein TonB